MQSATNSTNTTKRVSKRVATVYIATVAAGALLLSGCHKSSPQTKASPSPEPVPHVLTSDIQEGIMNHIRHQMKVGNGYFNLMIDGKKHKLRLVKIHTEYLATLGSREHFACVDLADTNGDVYDIDFFMHGDPGDMIVTKTMPHKFNGKPYFFWQQNEDGTWGRIKANAASQKLMGIIVPKDTFEFRYLFKLPTLSDNTRLWVPLPQSDNFQKVNITHMQEPRKHRILTDKKFGNKVIFWQLTPKDSNQTIDIRYHVVRLEKSAHPEKDVNPTDFLEPDKLIPNNATFKNIAQEVTRGKTGDYQKAHALYNRVIQDVKYAKVGDGWGHGDAQFACDSRHGNCTDFHSYFIALARAIGIPARFSIGAAIPSTRDDGGIDGYHCWVDFYADGLWWPSDISEGDKYPKMAGYYFTHHPANRIEFSKGRDIVLTPGPSSGPINFLAYPILEIDGKQVKVPISFSFHRDT